MNEKNTEYLIKTYPKLYMGANGHSIDTYLGYGFCCGDGWFKIIDVLSANIQNWVDNPEWIPKDPKWLQLCKKTVTSITWSIPIQKFVNWYFRRNIPHIYENNDPKAKTYDALIKNYYKWAERLAWKSYFCEPPEDPSRQVVVLQVKEKFGTLRFYCRGGSDYVRGLISMAECMSRYTCEECGSTDATVKANPSNWIAIRCDNCRIKQALKTPIDESIDQSVFYAANLDTGSN